MSKTHTYRTLEAASKSYFKEKGSKFYGFAFPVVDEEEVKLCLEELKQIHPGAGHHCYGYRLGIGNEERYRANDDGEPSNSAGKPIYGQLLSAEITNVLVVVVRYFGGTKLGVGGLISAYKLGAKLAIDSGKIVKKTEENYYQIEFDYLVMSEVMNFVKRQNLTVLSQEFQEICVIKFSVSIPKSELLVSELEKIEGVDVEFIEKS